MFLQKLSVRLSKAFASRWFFRISLAWFGLQATWLAFTGLYPMAFDEKHHFELIHLFTDKLLPFWSSVPEGSSAYGAIARDPSYLYHYLMSFPLRIIEPFMGSPTGQIIFLRLCSIAMFIGGIWLFRKLLRRAGCSDALTNVVLALFGALPLVPLLAAQVNYDNLLFLLTPACLLYLQKIIQSLRTKHRLDIKSLFLLASLSMMAALTKYAFLPVIVAMLGVLAYYYTRNVKVSWSKRWLQVVKDFGTLSQRSKVVLVGLFIVLFGLCIERYGVNMVRYRTPAPECDQVLSVQECLNFSPWRRNYYTYQSKQKGEIQDIDTNFGYYLTKIWFDKSNYQLFYSLDGPRAGYKLGQPFPFLHGLSLKLAAIGTLLLVTAYWKIRKRYQLGFLLPIAGTYTVTLLLQNYLEFLHLGYPFGIQARYLILFLPIAGAALASGYVFWLKRLPEAKSLLAVILIAIFLTQGGGAATYIMRSDSGWYWPNKFVVQANKRAQQVLWLPIVKR